MKGMVADTIAFSNVDGPGNRFVVFLQGCNFDCVACHNPQTIPAATGEHFAIDLDELLAAIRRAAPFLSGVTVSGGEATQQAPFVHALFTAIKADTELARLTCFVDSNGACGPETWAQLAPVMDGAMIDLKCLDPLIHQQMTGQPNGEVLAGIQQLHGLGVLYEVRLLILAGVNDRPELVRRTGQWLAAVDPTMRLKVIGFRAHGARPHTPPLAEPAPAALQEIVSQLQAIAAFDICVI
ncbi:MAG: radical SAM protein [Ilumatobacteraceae bacterium]